MRYRVKWRAQGAEPLQPEEFISEDAAKARVRELLQCYGANAKVDVWNENETWQIVSHTGVDAWCRS